MSRIAEGRTDAGDGSSDRPQVRLLTERAEILGLLEHDRAGAAAAFAYLEPAHFAQSRWVLAEAGGRWGLCLHGGGPGGGFLLTLGDPAAVAAAVADERGIGQGYVVCRLEHVPGVAARYMLRERQDMMRMAVTAESFRPVAGPVRRMGPHDVEALNRLYRSESGASFAPYHLTQGVYYGLWDSNLLVSVAGTQMISWSYGAAIVANVLTHPRYRGAGYATMVTSAVTAELLERCQEVTLNVDPENAPAVRAYFRLGYRDAGRITEAWGYRRNTGFLGWLQRWLARVFLGQE